MEGGARGEHRCGGGASFFVLAAAFCGFIILLCGSILLHSSSSVQGVSEAKRGAAEAGVSTVNPRMSTGEQRQASRDEAWRRRQVVRVLKTRRSAQGRLEALVRWRAHGPSRDSWEDAAALGLMEQGVVTPGLNAKPALQHDCTGGIGAFLPVHYAH